MKKRNLIFVVVASIVTLGLYDLYWFVSTRNELVKRGAKIPSGWGLVGSFLLLLAAILTFIVGGLAVNGDDLDYVNKSWVPIVASLALGIAGLVYLVYWIVKYCRGVAKITKDKFTFEVALASLIILNFVNVSFAWVAYTQYLYNKIK